MAALGNTFPSEMTNTMAVNVSIIGIFTRDIAYNYVNKISAKTSCTKVDGQQTFYAYSK